MALDEKPTSTESADESVTAGQELAARTFDSAVPSSTPDELVSAEPVTSPSGPGEASPPEFAALTAGHDVPAPSVSATEVDATAQSMRGSAPSVGANVASSGGPAPGVRDIDAIYRETDRLYYEFARGCGLSTTAFWSLVSAVVGGGSTTQAHVANEYSFSRQTVNSAIKNLEAKGLVSIAVEAGDRRSKTVSLTEAGQAFCEEHVRPAVDAERRAFDSLGLAERREFVRLVRAYADAIDAELGKLRRGTPAPPEKLFHQHGGE